MQNIQKILNLLKALIKGYDAFMFEYEYLNELSGEKTPQNNQQQQQTVSLHDEPHRTED